MKTKDRKIFKVAKEEQCIPSRRINSNDIRFLRGNQRPEGSGTTLLSAQRKEPSTMNSVSGKTTLEE